MIGERERKAHWSAKNLFVSCVIKEKENRIKGQSDSMQEFILRNCSVNGNYVPSVTNVFKN